MTITQLKSFIAVAENMHFSRAAAILHVSQPSLSYQITSLENELGVALFDRDTRKISITPVGAQLYDEAKELVDRFESINRGAISHYRPENMPKNFHIAIDTEAFFGEPDVYAAFIKTITYLKDTYTSTRVRFVFCNSIDCGSHLSAGDVDMAFGTLDTLPSGSEYNTIETSTTSLMLIAPKEYGGENDEETKANIIAYLEKYPLFIFNCYSLILPEAVSSLAEMGIMSSFELTENPMMPSIAVDVGIGAALIPVDSRIEHDLSRYLCLPLSQGIRLKRYIKYSKDNNHPMIEIAVNMYLRLSEEVTKNSAVSGDASACI